MTPSFFYIHWFTALHNAMPQQPSRPSNRAAPLPPKPPQQSTPQQQPQQTLPQQLQPQQPPPPQHHLPPHLLHPPQQLRQRPLSPPTLTPQGLLSSQPPQMLLEDDEEPVPSMPLPMYLQHLQPNRLQQQPPPTSLMQSLQSRSQQPGQPSLLQSVQVQSQLGPPPQLPVQTQAQPSPQLSQHQARHMQHSQQLSYSQGPVQTTQTQSSQHKVSMPSSKAQQIIQQQPQQHHSPRQHKSDPYNSGKTAALQKIAV